MPTKVEVQSMGQFPVKIIDIVRSVLVGNHNFALPEFMYCY